MLNVKDTGLEEFAFGEAPEDIFYILIDRRISPTGLDFDKLRLTNPTQFDAILTDMGCLLMLNGMEVEELIKRGELKKETLHADIFELARIEGLI